MWQLLYDSITIGQHLNLSHANFWLYWQRRQKEVIMGVREMVTAIPLCCWFVCLKFGAQFCLRPQQPPIEGWVRPEFSFMLFPCIVQKKGWKPACGLLHGFCRMMTCCHRCEPCSEPHGPCPGLHLTSCASSMRAAYSNVTGPTQPVLGSY